MSINQQIENLLAAGSADQYKSFLFNLQTTLIETGHVESLTEKGRSEFAARFQGLYDFFDQLSSKNNS